ncbi:MAG TPA: hypothetical protein VKM54_20975 [Myxococcota bacterium]|nr:hypothetical protein [Myxococcota bacterium]
MLFLGASIAAVGSFWAAIIESGFRKPHVVVLLGATIAAFAGLWNEMAAHEREQEIDRLNQQLLGWSTGFGSFASFEFETPDYPKQEHPLPILRHHGEFPLFDLHVKILDFVKSTTSSETAGTLPPDSQITNLNWPQVEGTHQDLLIEFWGRTGFWWQRFALRRVKARWRLASRVWREDGWKRVVLLEKIDEDFPRTKSGEPIW